MPPNSLGQANDERRRCNDCRQSQGLISQDAQFDTSKGGHKINQEQPDRLAIPYIHIHQVAPEHLVRDCEVECFVDMQEDRKSTRLNSSHYCASRMPYSDWKKKQ